MAKSCLLCGRPLTPGVAAEQIARESARREAFVKERVGHSLEPLEAMDLTRFMHGGPGQMLGCRACGVLVRDEELDGEYATDLYDSSLMKHLYPRYVQAFERKRPLCESLLRPGAEVVEVGSHLGAFLQTAEEWGWRPTGVDIGEFTSAFARRQGATVKRCTLADYAPKLRRPEAIFVWNCFEQLDDPGSLLRSCHALLDSGGLLVVRVPNADFYLREQHDERLLGYNNLLGFPYLHGYGRPALERLLTSYGFQPIAAWNSSLLTPPYPEMTKRVKKEWRQARRQGERNAGERGGPWIEVACRAAA